MYILFAVLSAIFASLTAILAKAGLSDVKSNLATAVRTVVVLLMAALICLVFGQFRFETLTPRAWLFLVLSGLATGLSWLCYFGALKLGSVSKVVPLDKLSTVFVMLLAYAVLGERATALGIAGGALIAGGAVMMAVGSPDDGRRSKLAIVLALGSALFAAATSILAKVGVEGVPSNLATLVRTAVILLFSWAIVFARGEQRDLLTISRRSLLFLLLSGVATGLSWLCYFGALAAGPVSVVAPIDKFSVVLTLVLSFLLLKEKVNGWSVAACVLITAGTLLLVL